MIQLSLRARKTDETKLMLAAETSVACTPAAFDVSQDPLSQGTRDKISSGGARVDNDVQLISNGLVLSSTVPRVDNDANINQLSTKVR